MSAWVETDMGKTNIRYVQLLTHAAQHKSALPPVFSAKS
jgi:hypothetical protein